MTDLEKRAKEYANNWLEHVKDLELQHKTDEKPEYIRIQQAYKDGATKETALLSQHILDLQKDKGNLTDRVRELEQQIEKMKNWCNCKNYQQCLIELAEQGKGMKPSECCRNCKKWEIKESGKRNV